MFLEKDLKKYDEKLKEVQIDSELSYIFSELDRNIHYEFNTEIYIHKDPNSVPKNLYKVIKLAEVYNLFKVNKVIIVDKKEKQNVKVLRNNGNLIVFNYELLNKSFSDIFLNVIKNSSGLFSNFLLSILLKSSKIAHVLSNSRIIIEEALKPNVEKEKIIFAILTGIISEIGAGFDRVVLFKKYGNEYHVYKAIGKSLLERANFENTYNLQKLLDSYEKGKAFSQYENTIKNYILTEKEIRYKLLFGETLKKNDANKLPTSALNESLIEKLNLKGEVAIVPLNFENDQYGFILCDNELKNTPISDEQIFALDYLGKQGAITLETKTTYEALKFEAETDSLTGLGNRHSYEKYIQKIALSGEKHIGIAMIDLDNFKKVNDTHGHKAGDDLLITFAKIVKDEIRKTDYAFRYGGDEFTIFFKDIDNEMLKLKLTNIENNFFNKTKMTFSAGGLITKKNIYEEIKKADELLYKSKNAGKGKITIQF